MTIYGSLVSDTDTENAKDDSPASSPDPEQEQSPDESQAIKAGPNLMEKWKRQGWKRREMKVHGVVPVPLNMELDVMNPMISPWSQVVADDLIEKTMHSHQWRCHWCRESRLLLSFNRS